jgi:hypothetical protein
MNKPATKHELLERIRSGHEALMRLVATIPDSRMTETGVGGSWSVRDILVHVVDWEQHLVRILQARRRSERPDFRPFANDDEMHRFNEYIVQANRSLPPDQARTSLQQSQRLLMEALSPLSEADLFDDSRREKVSGQTQDPVSSFIAMETYEHYQEHLDSIREWLGRTR